MATAGHHDTKPFRHRELARRSKGDVNLYRRQGSGSRFTFYEIGEGACGGFNSEPDFIVALNSAQYGGGYPGPNCFKMITIEYNGKRADARIVDECPSCPYGGLDLSQALFSFFASPDEGVIYGNWWYQDGSGGDTQQPVTSSEPPPTMTSSLSETTSTWSPLIQLTVGMSSSTTSDTWSTQASSTTFSSSSSSFSASLSSEHNVSSQPSSTTTSSSTQTSSSSISNSSNLAVPTGAIDPDQASLVRTIDQIVLGFGNLMAAGLRLQLDTHAHV